MLNTILGNFERPISLINAWTFIVDILNKPLEIQWLWDTCSLVKVLVLEMVDYRVGCCTRVFVWKLRYSLLLIFFIILSAPDQQTWLNRESIPAHTLGQDRSISEMLNEIFKKHNLHMLYRNWWFTVSITGSDNTIQICTVPFHT